MCLTTTAAKSMCRLAIWKPVPDAFTDGTDRVLYGKLRPLRLEQIEAKLQDLTRMRFALMGLIEACRHTANADPCPIIQALAPPQPAASCRSAVRSAR